jgi:hypothetical protein
MLKRSEIKKGGKSRLGTRSRPLEVKPKKNYCGPLSATTRLQHDIESPCLGTYNNSALYPHFDVVIEPDDNLRPLNGQRSEHIREHDDSTRNTLAADF